MIPEDDPRPTMAESNHSVPLNSSVAEARRHIAAQLGKDGCYFEGSDVAALGLLDDLAEEVERLREALRPFGQRMDLGTVRECWTTVTDKHRWAARRALGGE